MNHLMTRYDLANIPSVAELVCRYVVGLRYPDISYLEDLERYLDARYLPGMGPKVTSYLEWLDPLHRPLDEAPRPKPRIEVDWLLTKAGVVAASRLLASTMGELRIRRPSRGALLALAVVGALERDADAELIATALMIAGIERDGTKRWRTAARAGGPATVAALTSALQHAQPSFAAAPWLYRRLAWPTDAGELRRSLGQLARYGLVRPAERRETPVVTAGVLRRRHLETLRAIVRRGGFPTLSPLARGLLARRLDRAVKIDTGSGRGPMADTRAMPALAAAHLRASDGHGVDCLAEQVVLRHHPRWFSPFRPAAGSAVGPEQLATRRVDLTVWSTAKDERAPDLLVELERPNASTHVYDRVRSHVEAAMALSSTHASRVDVCFVAHSQVRTRVVAGIAEFRDEFRAGSAGAWSEAHVAVRVVPLGRARREGLDGRPEDFQTEYFGHRSGRGPIGGTSPIAFLARGR